MGESEGAGSELQAVQKEREHAERRVMETNSELTRMNNFVKTADLQATAFRPPVLQHTFTCPKLTKTRLTHVIPLQLSDIIICVTIVYCVRTDLFECGT